MRFADHMRTASDVRAAARPPRRRPHRTVLDQPLPGWLRLHPAGVVVGAAFAMLAMTPSLLPRDWLFQGLVSGVSAGVALAAVAPAFWFTVNTSAGTVQVLSTPIC